MILDSFDSAEEDFRQRQVIEARNEAGTIQAALEKGKRSPAWGQLTNDEKKRIAKLDAVHANGRRLAHKKQIDDAMVTGPCEVLLVDLRTVFENDEAGLLLAITILLSLHRDG